MVDALWVLVLEKRAEHDGSKLDLDVEPELGPELGPEMELEMDLELELELEHELELCWFESASSFFLVKSHSSVDSVSVACNPCHCIRTGGGVSVGSGRGLMWIVAGLENAANVAWKLLMLAGAAVVTCVSK